MKNIYHKVYIHPLYILIALIFIFTGHFKVFSSFMVVILFHEFGHILAALLMKWNIKRVVILPLGCMTEFNEKLNRPIYQEFLILIMGPVFQMILYMFYKNPYHYPILLLNLLPIYPLDGSKLVFLFSNLISSYHISYVITFIFSYATIFCLLFYYNNFIVFIFSIYWLLTSFEILKNKDIYFYQFLYERYLNCFPYYKERLIYGKKYKKMMRSVKHYFVINDEIIEEKYFLSNLFKRTSK